MRRRWLLKLFMLPLLTAQLRVQVQLASQFGKLKVDLRTGAVQGIVRPGREG